MTAAAIRETIRSLDPGTFYEARVTTATGRVVEDEDNGENLAEWITEFRRAEKLARVDVRELRPDEAHGIWSSPGA